MKTVLLIDWKITIDVEHINTGCKETWASKNLQLSKIFPTPYLRSIGSRHCMVHGMFITGPGMQWALMIIPRFSLYTRTWHAVV